MKVPRRVTWIAVLLLSLLVFNGAGQPGFGSPGGDGEPIATEMHEGSQAIESTQIDDGAVPLAELPASRELPLELVLMTGGLLFVGGTLYTHYAGSGRRKRRMKARE